MEKNRQDSFYFTWEQDGVPSENWADMTYTDRPGARRGNSWFLTIALRSAKRPAGKPPALDKVRIERLSKALRKQAKEHHALWVGESHFDGQIRQYYYGEDEAAVKMLVNIARKKYLDNEVEIYLDEAWEMYFRRVCPSAAQRQGMENKKIYAQIKKRGDRTDVVRRINHYLTFPTENARDRFMGAARQVGFALGEPFFAPEGEQPYGAYVQRRRTLNVEEITQDSTALIGCAEPLGGEYLYWDCALVRK